MSPERKAIIFDWNGTILADTALCWRAMNKTLEIFNVPPVSMKRYRETSIVPLQKMYRALGCDEKEMAARERELFQIFIDYYETHAPKLRPRRGARNVLKELRGRGHKLAVLSNYTTDRITNAAQRLGLLDYFDGLMANEAGGASNAFHKKSKGQRLQDFVATHETRQALVIGDTPEEIEIAHSYGFLGVALTDGVCSTARLRAAKPDFLIQSLEEIPEIAKKVF